jgi:hypothetical protein
VIASIFGILGFAWAIYSHYFPSNTKPTIDKHLYGIWYSKLGYKIKGGDYFIEGTTEYFKNNSYNFVGQIRADVFLNHMTLLVTYNVDGAGVWVSDSNSFLTTMSDMNSYPTSVIYNDEKIDIPLYEKILGEKLPNLDEVIPIGSSEEFRVVKLNKNEILVEVDDLQGNIIQFKMNRQKKRFQR